MNNPFNCFLGSEATMAPSMLDRDSGVLATTGSVEVYSAQPLPAEEVPPPSPGLSFGGEDMSHVSDESKISSIFGDQIELDISPNRTKRFQSGDPTYSLN